MKMCKFALLTLTPAELFKACHTRHTSTRFISLQSVKRSSLHGACCSFWMALEATQQQKKLNIQKSSAMKHNCKAICEFIDSVVALKKFHCSTVGFWARIILGVAAFALSKLLLRSQNGRTSLVPLGVSTGSFFRDGVLGQVDPLVWKMCVLRLQKVLYK